MPMKEITVHFFPAGSLRKIPVRRVPMKEITVHFSLQDPYGKYRSGECR